MAELPIWPLKTDALIADTTHMTAEEFGVYVRLLIAMWRHGGMLPNCGRELANIGGVHVKKWKAMSDRVLRPMTISGGFISQKRLTDTMLKVREYRETRSRASKIRWARERNAPGMHMHSVRNANQTKSIFSLTSTEQGAEKWHSSKEER